MNRLNEFFKEEEHDPVKIGIMIVLVIVCITILFWLFWSLIVYKGGFFEKIIPLISVVFTGRNFSDYGYEGWHEQGIFEGWIVNVVALLMLVNVVLFAARLLRKAGIKE